VRQVVIRPASARLIAPLHHRSVSLHFDMPSKALANPSYRPVPHPPTPFQSFQYVLFQSDHDSQAESAALSTLSTWANIRPVSTDCFI
jgi:hypothetical protein